MKEIVNMPLCIRLVFITLILSFSEPICAQDSGFITIRASDKYQKSASYQKKWGVHYRPEWYTPVTFRKANLDTLAGGLTPYERGGGRQSISLRLRDKNDREYVLRSIDKSYGKALPEITHGTFIEKFANDQVTTAHPYSALTIAPMAKAAGILHTEPVIYYIPKQKALGEYNDMGDQLYLFEQRPDENWGTAPNFGNSKNIVGTDKMLEKLHEDNDVRIDQLLFVRSRLFDMFIGDWGRHEDQWRWAAFKDGKNTIYKPVPRDRDQAYTLFDGSMVKIVLGLAGAEHMQSFDHRIKDLEHYNFPARNLDHHLTNEITKSQWIQMAEELQQSLTDKVIDDAVKQLPVEVYHISGPVIASKLKSRRALLTQIATSYYKMLAKEADITGSKDTELFDINRISDSATEIKIYKITNEGNVKKEPFYQRIFYNIETREIRLYGLDGKDNYKLSGKGKNGIDIRMIGGPDTDTYTDQTLTSSGKSNAKIYDNHNNDIRTSGRTKLKLSSDTAVHAFKWEGIKYSRGGFGPAIFFNNEDRFYVGIAYKAIRYKWRKEPFESEHYMDVKYSIGQQSWSTTYENTVTEVIGKWNLLSRINYDHVRWTNFFGTGNNTVLETNDRDYYRMRTREFFISAGLEQNIRNRHRITFRPFLQTVKILNDAERFVPKLISGSPLVGDYKTHQFAGAMLSYVYQVLNDSTLPTKGIGLRAESGYTDNINNTHALGKYGAELNIYLPLTKALGIFIKGGGSTLTGNPEFYQLNRIGGSRTLRGYERDRFYGTTTFYNQNELRLIKDVRSFLYNGKLGVFALYDIGRVWLDDDHSNIWHSGYGGGVILSPFNKISVAASYALSSENARLHLVVLKIL